MQCQKNHMSFGGICVSNKVAGTTTKTLSISKLALISAFVSVGGWALFMSIIKITGLTDMNPWIMGIVGFIIIIITTFLGWRSLK